MDVSDELMGCNNEGHDLSKTKILDLESRTATGKKRLFHEGAIKRGAERVGVLQNFNAEQFVQDAPQDFFTSVLQSQC